QAFLVEELVVAPQQPVAELVPQLATAIRMVPGDLAEIAGRLAEHFVVTPAQSGRQLPDPVEEGGILEQLPDLEGVGEPPHQLFRSSRTSSKPSRMQVAKTSMSVMASGSRLNPTQQVPS